MSEILGPSEEMLISEQLQRIEHQLDVLEESGIMACLKRELAILNDGHYGAYLNVTIRTKFEERIKHALAAQESYKQFANGTYVEPAPLTHTPEPDPDLTLTLAYNVSPRMQEKMEQKSGRIDCQQIAFQVLQDDTIEAGSYQVIRGIMKNATYQKVVLPFQLWQENDLFKLRPAERAIYSLLLPKEPANER